MLDFFGKSKESEENKKNQDTPVEISTEDLIKTFGNSEDFVSREIKIGDISFTIAYIDGMISSTMSSDYVLKPLLTENVFGNAKSQKEILSIIESGKIYFINQKITENLNDVIAGIIDGNTALIFDKEKKAVLFENKGFDKRAIVEPTGENVIKGSKDCFIENIRSNTATIRRKIKSPMLRFKSFVVGEQTITKIDVVFLENIADPELVEKIVQKIKGIDVDCGIVTANIMEYICDNKYTVFPQSIYTERPDKFCANIVEGRVGIVIDGIPAGIILPATLVQCMQAPEDYSQNYIIASIIRFLRFCLISTTLTLPAIYTSLVEFHQEMIPAKLALAIDATKEGVPFYSFVEVIVMLIAFEILVEAGVRLPKTIGQAVSIVGAIIVGQAASQANIVCPAVVVFVAVTAIASFAMPNQDFSNAIRLWRFIFVILSSFAGLFGLSLGLLFFLHHLSKLQVFGVPYLSPLVAYKNLQLEDSLFRFHVTKNIYRPFSISPTNKKRRKKEE